MATWRRTMSGPSSVHGRGCYRSGGGLGVRYRTVDGHGSDCHAERRREDPAGARPRGRRRRSVAVDRGDRRRCVRQFGYDLWLAPASDAVEGDAIESHGGVKFTIPRASVEASAASTLDRQGDLATGGLVIQPAHPLGAGTRASLLPPSSTATPQRGSGGCSSTTSIPRSPHTAAPLGSTGSRALSPISSWAGRVRDAAWWRRRWATEFEPRYETRARNHRDRGRHRSRVGYQPVLRPRTRSPKPDVRLKNWRRAADATGEMPFPPPLQSAVRARPRAANRARPGRRRCRVRRPCPPVLERPDVALALGL